MNHLLIISQIIGESDAKALIQNASNQFIGRFSTLVPYDYLALRRELLTILQVL